MGLNDGYDTVRSQILMKNSLPLLSEVYNLLDNEDTQKSARMLSQYSNETSAFQMIQPSSQSQGGFQYQKKDTRPVCTFCEICQPTEKNGNTTSEALSTDQPSTLTKPEVHSVSVSSILFSSSSNTGPTPGSFSGINDWNG